MRAERGMKPSGSNRAARRMARMTLWLGWLLNLALITAVLAVDDDRFSALAASASWAFCVWSLIGWLGFRPLSPPAVFLYVFGAFHLGLAAPWALGIAAEPIPYWFLSLRVTPALNLVIAATAAFQTGAALAARSRPRRGSGGEVQIHNSMMSQCGWALTALGVAAMVWGAYVLGFQRLAEASYFETYRITRTFDPRFFVTSLQLTPMGLYLAAAAAPRERLSRVLWVGVLWSAGIFLLGFRGFALTPLATSLAVLDKRGLRLPRAAYLACALLLLLAIPAARAVRENRLAERSIADAAVTHHPLDALQEMGGSLRPLVHTLDLMENENLRWGKTYWQAATMIVPNIGLRWEGDSYVPVEDLPPSHWVTRLASPWHYYNYGGLGFSIVAEPYMNWGVPGVIGVFLLLGAGLVRADRLDGLRPTRLAMWAMALGPLLWMVRNSSTVFFRPAVWGVAAVLAAHLLSRLWVRPSARPSLRSSAAPFAAPIHPSV